MDRALPVLLIGALTGCVTAVTGWSALQVPWQPTAAPGGSIDLAAGTVSTFLSPKDIGGRWLRVTARTASKNPDFNIWIQMFDKNVRPYVRVLPTVCEVEGSERVCVNAAWIDPAAYKVRIALTSLGRPTIVTGTLVELGSNAAASPTATKKFEEIASNIQSLYYKSAETDWKKAEVDARQALVAPGDIDPVPEAVALLIAHLPGNQHSSISRDSGAPKNSGEAILPVCKLLPNGTLRLDLPGTSPGSGDEYISSAHRCLETTGASRWLINLTGDSGGNSFVQFGALQPIFGNGDQMEMRGSSGGVFPLSLSSTTASLGGRPLAKWAATQANIPPEKVTFISGPGCASACESLLIAAKGRFHIIGKPSAGFTTSNESVAIDGQFVANITSGFMTALGGAYSARIEPDIPLGDIDMKNALQTGAY
jgi:hypothetical protein